MYCSKSSWSERGITSRSMGRSCRLLGALRMTLRVCTRSYTLRLEWYTLRQWMNCSLSKSLSRRLSALCSFLTLADSVRALEATELADELSDMRSRSVLLILAVWPGHGATLVRVRELAWQAGGTGWDRRAASRPPEDVHPGYIHAVYLTDDPLIAHSLQDRTMKGATSTGN